jgi:hypothetical protein
MTTQAAQERNLEHSVPLAALAIAFLKVALYGIGGGGGLVWARRIAVDQRRWISDQDFTDIVSLCQFMPGPNIVGIAVCVGTKLRGSIGAIAAVAGFLLIPWTIGFTLGVLYLQHAHHPAFQNILGGVSAAAASASCDSTTIDTLPASILGANLSPDTWTARSSAPAMSSLSRAAPLSAGAPPPTGARLLTGACLRPDVASCLLRMDVGDGGETGRAAPDGNSGGRRRGLFAPDGGG